MFNVIHEFTCAKKKPCLKQLKLYVKGEIC